MVGRPGAGLLYGAAQRVRPNVAGWLSRRRGLPAWGGMQSDPGFLPTAAVEGLDQCTHSHLLIVLSLGGFISRYTVYLYSSELVRY